jgi:hypothetical protein
MIDCPNCGRTQPRLNRRQFCACGHELGTEPVQGPQQPNRDRGFGDTVYRITSAIGIPHCGGCEQRRETLNRWIPYGDSDQPQ